MPIAGALQFANALASPFREGLASLPGGKMITTPPLETEQVARAVIAGIESKENGIFDVSLEVVISRQTFKNMMGRWRYHDCRNFDINWSFLVRLRSWNRPYANHYIVE